MSGAQSGAGSERAPGTGSSAIEIEGFSFSYQGSGAWQLSAITTGLARGERLAVMGATGAGKSTLAMALNGLIPHHHSGQTHGGVRVDGLDTAHTSTTELVRRVGLVMQDPETQITGQTVLGDAAVGPANLGLPRETVLDRAGRALDLVGMQGLEDRDATALSGGQKQRLAIAGIIAMQPETLVLDEPTSELDPQATAEVFEVVKRLSTETETSLIMIDHEPEIIASWADRLLVLLAGRVVYDGGPGGFFADPDAVAAAGLRSPQVAEIALALRDRGAYTGPIPATLEDAAAVLPRFATAAAVAPHPVAPEDRVPADEGEIVVDARGLGHVYPGGVAALADVDVQIRAGEFLAVLGRNGAGKTTFARHLNGLLRPSSGSLSIAGQDSSGLSVGRLAMHVGYVFQNPDHQIFANSVRDEIGYGLKNQGWEPDRIAARVDAVLERVDMTEFAERHPFTLGKGQRQRLAVASVLALEPEVLVIDEPTTGQDHVGARAMLELIADLNGSGHTVVMITHDMTLVAEYARRTLLFAGGRLIADTTPRELFGSADLLERSSLVPPQATLLAQRLGASRTVTTPHEYLELFAAARGEASDAH